MLKRSFTLALLLSVYTWLTPAQAVTVQYQLTSLGGDNYRYDYTINNDGSLGSGIAVELMDIYFDPALYLESSLLITTPAPLNLDWDENLLGSAPLVPAAYDLYALAGGVADGATLSGFSIEFTWLGGVTGPGSQDFEIYDPFTFELLEVGATTVVPVPAAAWLMLSGLLGLISVAR
ncbi:MAG: hypothetical protein EP315_06935, partial [Gammaproteobacteria bacterium]